MSVEFSATDASFASDDVDVPTDPDDIFEQLLADPSRCCQHCFRRLRSRRRFPDQYGERYAEILSFVDVVYPPGIQWELLEREHWETELEPDRTEDAAAPMGPPTSTSSACRFCGTIDMHRSPSTRSRAAAIEAAVGISATLTEHAIPHNPLVLVVEVADLKQDPDHAGDDFETFRLATSRAVRAAPSR